MSEKTRWGEIADSLEEGMPKLEEQQRDLEAQPINLTESRRLATRLLDLSSIARSTRARIGPFVAPSLDRPEVALAFETWYRLSDESLISTAALGHLGDELMELLDKIQRATDEVNRVNRRQLMATRELAATLRRYDT